MFSEIDRFDSEELLKNSDEAIAEILIEKYILAAPQLLESKITQRQEECQIDVSQEFDRGILDRSRPFYIPGTKVIFYVPFEGNGSLFNYASSMTPLNPPHAVVGNGELLIIFTFATHDTQAIKTQFAGVLSQIKQLLIGTTNDVNVYNDNLKQKAVNRIKIRREKILKDRQLVDELGYPTHE